MHYWSPCSGNCACCGEQVGVEDSDTIRLQLQNREKNCFWCGEDFDLNEDEIEECIANPHDYTNDHFFPVCEPTPDEIQKMSYDARRSAIKNIYGINIDKEEFIPPFVDKKTGRIYDRAYNAEPYLKIIRDYIAYRILLIVKDNPGISMSVLEGNNSLKKSFSFYAYSSNRYKTISEKPVHRLVAADLLDMESTHCGWIKQPTKTSGLIYEHGVPKYRRTYMINSDGLAVLNIFDNPDKKMVIL